MSWIRKNYECGLFGTGFLEGLSVLRMQSTEQAREPWPWLGTGTREAWLRSGTKQTLFCNIVS